MSCLRTQILASLSSVILPQNTTYYLVDLNEKLAPISPLLCFRCSPNLLRHTNWRWMGIISCVVLLAFKVTPHLPSFQLILATFLAKNDFAHTAIFGLQTSQWWVGQNLLPKFNVPKWNRVLAHRLFLFQCFICIFLLPPPPTVHRWCNWEISRRSSQFIRLLKLRASSWLFV